MYTKSDYKDGTSAVLFWGVIALMVVLAAIAIKVIAFPAAVVGKTFDANTAITKYEWFHDASNVINAKVLQVQSHKQLLSSVTDPGEKSRVNIEVAGIQQSCRELVAQYNANASKANVSIFKTAATPASFDLSICN